MRIIGRFVEEVARDLEYPYDVSVNLDDPTRPIGLGEGSGHGSIGGSFTLQEIRDPEWREHLKRCGCEWLVTLAEEEERRGIRFLPDQILERWKTQ
ncbi:MAG TPA: hypothetical protein VEB66_09475 [Opitutaceae bacterium]|nr:hypothetical protein [Opitutaceae bacterium]